MISRRQTLLPGVFGRASRVHSHILVEVMHVLRVCLQLQSPASVSCIPLQVAAKQAAAAATQTIAASQNAAVSNKNPAAQQQLVQSCKVSCRVQTAGSAQMAPIASGRQVPR